MKIHNNIDQNENDSPDVHVYDKSGPTISPKLLAKSIYRTFRRQFLPKEAFDALTEEVKAGNLEAVFCLTHETLSRPMPLKDCEAVGHEFLIAQGRNDPYALYVNGSICVQHDDPTMKAFGEKHLIEAAEKGIPEASWALALHYARLRSNRAYDFYKRAIQAGWDPAVQAGVFARYVSRNKKSEKHGDSKDGLHYLHNSINILNARIQTLANENDNLKAELHNQAGLLQKRCEEAESRLATRTTEMLRDEAIVQLQAQLNQSEEEWLKAKLESEHAAAVKIEAERKAEDLTRRNKRLAGLLRKNRIPFNEYESSSSSENGESHLGLAS